MLNMHAEPQWHTDDRFSDRRTAGRLAHVERVLVATSWGDIDGTLVDVSSFGGQIRIANGLVPFDGDEVTLRLVGAGQFGGRVAWSTDEAVGIAFDQPITNINELFWIEQRGAEWYSRAALGHRRAFA